MLSRKVIWLLVAGVVSGIYFGSVSGSSSLMVRGVVGVVMGGLTSWLISGFLK